MWKKMIDEICFGLFSYGYGEFVSFIGFFIDWDVGIFLDQERIKWTWVRILAGSYCLFII